MVKHLSTHFVQRSPETVAGPPVSEFRSIDKFPNLLSTESAPIWLINCCGEFSRRSEIFIAPLTVTAVLGDESKAVIKCSIRTAEFGPEADSYPGELTPLLTPIG